MKVSIGVSNRHIHLNKKNLEILFGKGYELKNAGDLSQPGQFKAEEKLTIKTSKSEIPNVRVLGPLRDYTQVEVSKTDSYKLGINPPVRNSGDLENSEVVTLIGPKGSVETDGCIIATRHIHLSKEHIEKYNLKGIEKVSVIIEGEKGGIINNVYLKEAPNSFLEMHLDTDDANAHLIKCGDIAEVIIEGEK